MLMEIRDNVIWARHLEAYRPLQDAVLGLAPGEEIRLSVDGLVGTWTKMKRGLDGRPVQGIRPVGAMAEVWKRLQARRGEKVQVRWPEDEDDALLTLADLSFDEWRSAEDEEAFGELRPL